MNCTVVYARISSDRAGAGLGVQRQVDECKLLAASLGLGEVDVLTDNDLSAWSGKRRPGYEQLLDGLRAGRWQTLIVWHLDRLTRSPKDLETLVDVLNASGVALHTAKGGEVDLTTAEGRMTARILGTLARYESDHKSDRVKARFAKNAAAGKDSGGGRRYGWIDRSGALDPDEAKVVRDITQAITSGETVYGLAGKLNAQHAPSPSGKPWTPSTVRKLVQRPRNAGLVLHRGELVTGDDGQYILGDWAPIVTVDGWRAVCAVLADPDRKTSPGNQPRWLVSGIAVCGAAGCGAPMRAGARRGEPIYRCSAAFAPGKTSVGHATRSTVLVDGVVMDIAAAWLSRDGASFDIPSAPAVDRRAEINALRILVDRAEDMLMNTPPDELRDVSPAGIRRNLAKHRARLAELEREDVLSGVPSPLEGVTGANLRGLPLERRRAVVSYLVDVTIQPVGRGNVAGEDSIAVTPKLRG